jgi:radical SAM protein with 4Fe4S-binding SPASM domain
MYKCYAGVVRTFCSSQGFLYPCERTETGELFKLGDAYGGVDVNRSFRLIETFRLLGDCGNCPARAVCTLCPAAVLESNSTGRPDTFRFQSECWQQGANLRRSLEEYTRMMEMNRDVVDNVVNRQESDDWLEHVQIVLTDEQKEVIEAEVKGFEAEAETEELEEMV